jgi:Domain of unknown function DUF11
MRSALVVLALCCLPFSASAQSADFVVTSLTSDKSAVLTGDRFTLTIRVRNDGPDAAREPNINILNSYGQRLLVVASSASPGWNCSPVDTNCFTDTFPAGAEAELKLTVLAPTSAHPNTPLTLTAHASSADDRNFENNRKQVIVTLQHPTREAEIGLFLGAPDSPIPENTLTSVTWNVRNHGPDSVSNILVPVRFSSFGLQIPVTWHGEGWTCTPVLAATLCSRAELPAGATAPLIALFTTPSVAAQISIEASVYADQPRHDNDPSNELAATTLWIGKASDWSRILLPIVAPETPGANGARWRAEMTGLIDASEHPRMDPRGCGREDPCSPPPLQRQFDIWDEPLIVANVPAQFLYIAREQAHLFHVTTRVYDASREGETAGAFIPSPRDADFSPSGFSLIGIPVAPEYRTTLRIYNYDGRDHAPVIVSLYGDDEAEPFAESIYALDSGRQPFRLTTALLPGQPALAQIDLTPLIPPGRYERLRVSVRPEAAPVSLWGIVSITNNETHHVTVITP